LAEPRQVDIALDVVWRGFI